MHFFPDEFSTEKEDREEMRKLLKHRSEEVCCICLIDEDKVLAHTVGVKNEVDFIWSFNSWGEKNVKKEFIQGGLDLVKKWAVEKFNIHELQCHTFRNPRVMERAYGWKFYSAIMKINF